MVKCSCRHDRLVIRFIHFSPCSDLLNTNTNFFQMTSISLAVWEQSPSFWNLYVLIKKAIGRVPIIQSRLHRNSCHSNLDISGCEAAWDISAAGVRPHFRTVFIFLSCMRGGFVLLISWAWSWSVLLFFFIYILGPQSPHLFPAIQKQHSCHLASSCSAWYLGVEIDFFLHFSVPSGLDLEHLPFWLTKQITGNKIFSCHQKIDFFFSAQELILRKLCFKNDQHPWTSSVWAGLHIKCFFFIYVFFKMQMA